MNLPIPTSADALKEMRRELRMRESAYPRWVTGGTLKQEEADRRMAAFRVALKIVEEQATRDAPQQGLGL